MGEQQNSYINGAKYYTFVEKWLERHKRGRYGTHVSTGGSITFGSNLMICLNIWIEMMKYDHIYQY